MKDFVDTLTKVILANERPRLDNIMRYVSGKIQEDMVALTYSVIDAYYQDYMPPDRAYYIRTEEYKAKHDHPKNNKGQFRHKSKTEWSRSKDRSLMSAIKALDDSGQPAIGVNRPLDGAFGYQAGVIFDPDYFSKAMHHEHKGFTEWDITENFLFGQHGNGGAIYFTEPHADIVLRDYLDAYKPKFDKHYSDACRQFM